MRTSLLIAWCAALVGSVSLRADEPSSYRKAADNFPLVEKMPPAEFIVRASDFLRDQPQSPFAPRVALDLLTVATIAHDEAKCQRARELLLFDYPASPQAGFLVSLYRQPNEFADFLVKAFDEHVDVTEAAFARRYWSAVDRGMAHFNSGLLDHGGLAMRVVLSTETHPRHPLRAAAKGVLENNQEEVGAVGRILLDERLSSLAKIERLHSLPSPSPSDLAERFLINQLPEHERKKVRNLDAANHLARGKLREAAAILDDQPPEDADADGLYMRALYYARLQDRARAVAALELLNKRFPQSRWREIAGPFLESLTKAESNQEVFQQCIADLVVQIRTGQWDTIETSFAVNNPTTHRLLHIYAALAIDQNRLECQIRDDDRVVIAYRSRNRGCDVFVDGDPAIRRLAQSLLSIPQVALQESSDGTLNLSWQIPFGAPLRAAARANRGLLDSDLLASAAGIGRCLASLDRNGWFLQSAEERGGRVRLVWIRPPVEGATHSRIEITVDNEKHSFVLSSGFVECKRLRHGMAGSFDPAPPPWPDLPVQESGSADFSLFAHAMTAVADLFKRPPSVASAEKAPLR